jgi:HlyD family secretion protein
VASGQSVSSAGALVTNVEIVFANPGALSPGAYATAVVGDYACNDAGLTEYANQDTIYSKGSGKIVDLTVNVGDRINAGQRIFFLENTSIDEALTRASKNVGDAEKKLGNTQNSLQITSPIAGTVLAKSAKAGDSLYENSTTLAVVADMSCLTFTIDVDELEIRYVATGQQATVTADAYVGETFAGVVTNVGKTGTSASGVTTYSVTIEIAEYGGLLPGMNVNADIVVREALDVLYVPVDAVTRGNLVLVKDDGSGQSMPPRGEGQGGFPQMPQGEGGVQGDAPPQFMRGEGQGQGNAPAGMTRGAGQGDAPPQMPRGEGQGMPSGGGQGSRTGFMGAQAPAGFIYRVVETGISDSDYVEIISGINEGDMIAYYPAQKSSNEQMFMFMPSSGGVMMPSGGGGGMGGAVRRF